MHSDTLTQSTIVASPWPSQDRPREDDRESHRHGNPLSKRSCSIEQQPFENHAVPPSFLCSSDLQSVIQSEHVSPAVGILILEDSRMLRKALEEGFRKQGFCVWAAADGSEGVELYRKFWPKIELVLSDVQMPVLDGPTAIEVLRAINPSVRFCFMTGDTRAGIRESLLRRGAMRVLDKPIASVVSAARELWELANCPNAQERNQPEGVRS